MRLELVLQPAYVLHTRRYLESSLIVEIFSLDYGRIALIAKGAQGPKSAFGLIKSPFQALLISASGKGELLTLKSAEINQETLHFPGHKLKYGFYLNELIMRLTAKFDPHLDLFKAYGEAIKSLASQSSIEPVLRAFELKLLALLGYELELSQTIAGEEILAEKLYSFDPLQGASLLTSEDSHTMRIAGASLLAMGQEDFRVPQTLSDAKRILRSALKIQLGNKPLESRRML